MTKPRLIKPLHCISHRGARGDYTENTLGAFDQALQMGVDGIELDVWNIGGELLITHDRRLGKTLPGQGLLLQQSPQFLRSLTLPCGSQLCTLQEVLTLVADRAQVNIELKGPNCVDLVAATLEAHVNDNQLSNDQFCISSFDHMQLHQFQQRSPEVRRGVLIEGIPLGYARCCEELNAYSFHPGLNFVNQALIDDARRRGLKTWVYTVNEDDDLVWVSQLGVDGVFTDRPERLLQLNRESTGNG